MDDTEKSATLLLPRSFPPNSRCKTLLIERQKSLGSKELQVQIKLPQGANEDEWLAVKTIDFFNELNLLKGALQERGCRVRAFSERTMSGLRPTTTLLVASLCACLFSGRSPWQGFARMRDVAPGQLSEDVAELQRLVRVSERARHIAELGREVLESALSHHEAARALQRCSAAARTAHSRAQDAAGSWAEERDRFQVVRQSRITSGSLPRRSRSGRVKSDSEVGLLRKICETRASVERMLALTSDRRRRMDPDV